MIQGVDFNEGFAPGSLDVKTAYLNSPIDEDVYVKPPPDFIRLLRLLRKRAKSKPDRDYIKCMIALLDEGAMLKLLKAIYGT